MATTTTGEVLLGLAEQVCLALVDQGVDHGWAIGGLLAPDGDLGRIWSLSRPLTYRALDQLTEKRLVTRTATATGRGRERQLLAATAAGRRRSRRWLDEPVVHLRDVRTELLLKLELRRRAGLPLEPLLQAQADAFAPTIEGLTRVREPDHVARWRREHARAVSRFLRATLAEEAAASHEAPAAPETALALSARNQLRVTVDEISFGDMVCTVRGVLPDGQTMAAVVTREAVEHLDLAEGDVVVMVAKATETLVARLDPDPDP